MAATSAGPHRKDLEKVSVDLSTVNRVLKIGERLGQERARKALHVSENVWLELRTGGHIGALTLCRVLEALTAIEDGDVAVPPKKSGHRTPWDAIEALLDECIANQAVQKWRAERTGHSWTSEEEERYAKVSVDISKVQAWMRVKRPR